MHFLNNSKSKKKDKSVSESSLSSLKKTPAKRRPISVQSTPDQIHIASQNSSTPSQISLNRAGSLRDIGNNRGPYVSSSNNGTLSLESQRVLNSKIRPVRPQRAGKPFLHLNRSRSRADTDTEDEDDEFGENGSALWEENSNRDLFTPSKHIGPGAVEYSLPREQPRHSESLAESSPVSHSIKSSKQPAHEVEEHMANPDSTVRSESGIFNSIIHAAQNAASTIGNIANTGNSDIKPHHASPSASTDDKDEATTLNFMQHLDTLLFNQPAKKSAATIEENAEQGDNISTTSLNTKSYAHDVKFEPLRKSAIATMGKGGLTLEDLGFTESSQYSQADVSGNASQKSPKIKISQSSPAFEPRSINGNGVVLPLSSAELSPRLTFETHQLPNSVTSPLANSQINNGSIPPLRLDNQKIIFDEPKQSSIISRSNSSSNVKRSLSPNIRDSSVGLDPYKRSHRRSFSSGNNLGEQNTDDSISNQPFKHSNESNGNIIHSISNVSVELKDVTLASEKRNNEFHNLFRTLSKSEGLIDDFSCALQKDILVQGKLYLSEGHVSFKSNILGWVTSITIPIQEIVQLEKKSTAGLFPNGIVIQTLHQRYSFASFLSRDSTFYMILNVWNQLVRGSADGGDIGMNYDLGLSREQTYTTDPEDYSTSEEEDYDDDGNDDSDDFDVNADDDDKGRGGSAGISKHEPTEPKHKETPNEKKVIEAIISAPVGKVYQALFGDDSSTLNKILEKQKNFDIDEIPSFSKENDSKKRSYSYTKPLNSPVGPKQTNCQVTETVDYYDLNSYIQVTQNTKTPDVPSGTSFSVNTTFYLSWGPNNSTKILVFTFVDWTAKSWIKGAVEKGAIDGQKESIGILVEELQSLFSSSATTDSDEHGESLVSSLPTIGPPTHSPTEHEYKSKQGDTEIVTETIPAPLGTVYQILFGNDTSYFKSILLEQKNFDLTEIPKFDGTSEGSTRKYSYIKPLGSSIGPKETKCNITETIQHFDLNKYVQVLQVTATPDVPSGSSFTVHTDIYLSWASNNSTQIFVVTNVVWTGKSWIKGPIEKGSIDGQKESVGILVSELKSIISKAETGGKYKKKKKGKVKQAKKEPSLDFIDEVLKDRPVYNFLSSFQNSSLNSFGLLFFVIVMLWISIRLFSTGSFPGKKVAIKDIDKALIGGKEYFIIPSVDQALKERSLKEKAEFDIWEWINDRTDTVSKGDRKRGVARFYEEQQMRELIREAENKIETLKRQIHEEYE